MYQKLSTAAQTAYASLSSACQYESIRNIASVPGGFTQKQIKGIPYWYYQTVDLSGKQKQVFLGRATDELTSLIELHKSGRPKVDHLKQLSQIAIAAGCPSMTFSHARILRRLSDAGFFHAGGILIGTHVYMGYQNYLGVRWTSGAQTLDLDFAHAGKNISIAIPTDVTMDMGNAIDSLSMGFVPVKSLTTYVKADEPDLQIDFVTSLHRGGDTPVLISAINAVMQPLKFMEFSMAEPIQMTFVSSQGPINVNVPPPEKYAVHKLLVHGERPQAQRVKASKDLEQSASLISYLSEHDADRLNAAWINLVGRGKGWSQRAQIGLAALQKQFPAVDTTSLELPRQRYVSRSRMKL